MVRQWAKPFSEPLLWSAVGMSCASVAVLLVGGALSELLGSTLLFWLSLMLMAGLSAPCIGMVIGADTCRPGDDPVNRSTHGFIIGCSVLGGCITAVIELALKLG